MAGIRKDTFRRIDQNRKRESDMKLIILVVIIVTVLSGVCLMRVANDLSNKIAAPLKEVLKDIE
jgi:hypothetical protein